jgi:hypothetical protein
VDAAPISPLANPGHDHSGCVYPLSGDADHRFCDSPRRLGSPYCPRHHALCHVRSGTKEEIRRLREVEALANMVGGRRARDAGEPPRRFLKRLERAGRDF